MPSQQKHKPLFSIILVVVVLISSSILTLVFISSNNTNSKTSTLSTDSTKSASLSFSLNEKTSNTVSVDLFVNTSGKDVNVIETTLEYDQNFLQIKDIEYKNGFSSTGDDKTGNKVLDGTTKLLAFSTNPQSSDKLNFAKVNFVKVVPSFEGELKFSDSKILASDGSGTDIFKSSSNLTLNF
jgi:hypothetical protein